MVFIAAQKVAAPTLPHSTARRRSSSGHLRAASAMTMALSPASTGARGHLPLPIGQWPPGAGGSRFSADLKKSPFGCLRKGLLLGR